MQQVSNPNQAFEQAFNTLNPAQREAVINIENPVMVIAGPGTGKTQILAARIGYILKNTDTQPGNILCLTFTDAGVLAMRKRLFSFIGSAAYQVSIHTFHSFAHKVISDNLDYFGLRSLEPVDDIEKSEVLRELIDGLPFGHPLRRTKGDLYYEEYRMARLFDLMKQENLSSENLKQHVQNHLDALHLDEDMYYKVSNSRYGFKKGDFKQKAFDEMVEKFKKTLAAAELYEAYNEKLLKRNRYEFNDMILWCLRAFQENEALLQQYQERFNYYLVDEFQDNSGSQSELLHLLISFWDPNPNVFVVGDDDQSIYAFQNANVYNLIQFREKYKANLLTVMLTENYRSVQPILDASLGLISINQERLAKAEGLEKHLLAALPALQKLNIIPEVHTYPNSYHEVVGVARQIIHLVDEIKVDPKEIAVIYRKHKHGELIAKYLKHKGVNLQIKKKFNLLHEPVVKQLLNILQYLVQESEKPHSSERLLFEMMHYPALRLNSIAVARLSTEAYQSKRLEDLTQRKSYRELLSEWSVPESNPDFQNLNDFSKQLESWIKSVYQLTPQALIEKLIREGGFLFYVMHHPDRLWLYKVLKNFFELVKDFCARKPESKLQDIITRFQLMVDNKIEAAVYEISYAPNGVNLLTAHGAKGLEFEYVFMINSGQKDWIKGGNAQQYAIPNTMPIKKVETDDVEEERRLFFVGMTRAKKHLYMSYSEKDEKEKDQEPVQFIQELLAQGLVAEESFAIGDEELISFELDILQKREVPQVQLIDAEHIDAMLEDYSMSVTHLNSYLRCPLSYYFEYVLRVPRAKSEAMTYGSAVHEALDKLFKSMLQHPEKEFPSSTFFLEPFKWYMNRNRDSFTQNNFELRLQEGEEVLLAYYDYYHAQWHKQVVTETKLEHVVVDGVKLVGLMDKVELFGNEINIIDYKTGNPDTHPERLKAPKDEEDIGGDYWRQAVFYKILVDEQKEFNWKVKSTTFDFVEKNKSGKYVKKEVVVTSQDVDRVKTQIRTAYKGIKQHQFKGCGEENCYWCNLMIERDQLNKKQLANPELD